jgi:hypothetical protein
MSRPTHDKRTKFESFTMNSRKLTVASLRRSTHAQMSYIELSFEVRQLKVPGFLVEADETEELLRSSPCSVRVIPVYGNLDLSRSFFEYGFEGAWVKVERCDNRIFPTKY